MRYREATLDDMELLVERRLIFLEVDATHQDYIPIRENCRLYFQKALADSTCDIILAEDQGLCIGTCIVFYYDSVPSVSNHAGKNAFITNMYVEEAYRSQGVGKAILTRVIAKAVSRGYPVIMLNASEMGKPMYRKMGFEEIPDGMILDTRKAI